MRNWWGKTTGVGLSGRSINGESRLVWHYLRGTAARREVRVITKEQKTGVRRWAFLDGFVPNYSIIQWALTWIIRRGLVGSPLEIYCNAWTAGDLEERLLMASLPPCSEGNHHLNNRRSQSNFVVFWNGGVGEAQDFRKYQDLETIANSLHPKVLVPIARWSLLLQAHSMTMIHGPTGCISSWIFPSSFVLTSYD